MPGGLEGRKQGRERSSTHRPRSYTAGMSLPDGAARVPSTNWLPGDLSLRPLTQRDAHDIAEWRYDGPGRSTTTGSRSANAMPIWQWWTHSEHLSGSPAWARRPGFRESRRTRGFWIWVWGCDPIWWAEAVAASSLRRSSRTARRPRQLRRHVLASSPGMCEVVDWRRRWDSVRSASTPVCRAVVRWHTSCWWHHCIVLTDRSRRHGAAFRMGVGAHDAGPSYIARHAQCRRR